MISFKSLSRFTHAGGLQALALRGSAWTVTGFGLQYAIRLGSTLITTRLLMPEVFGLMNLALLFVVGLALISDLGTTAGVIRSPRGSDPDFLRTAWTIQVIRGFVICLSLCLLAWPIAQLYDQPVLFPLLCVLSLTAIFDGFKAISAAMCQRNMDLFRLTGMELIAQIVGACVTIFVAWQYQSVWALAAGVLTGSFLRLVLSFVILPPFAHRFRFEKAAVQEIIRFGIWILLGTLLTYLGGQGSNGVIGFYVPLETFGLFAIASIFALALGDLALKLLGNIALPTVSKIARERPGDLPQVLKKIQKLIFLAVIPVFFLLSFLGQSLIDLMYDDRYALAGPMLQLLALNTAISVLSMPYQNTMLAIGKSQLHALVMGCMAVFRITGLLIGVQFAGIWGAILGIGVGTVLSMFVSAFLARREGFANLRFDAAALIPIICVYAYMFMNLQTG